MSTQLSSMHENHIISWLFFQAILCDFFSKANYIYRTCDFLRQYYVTFQKKCVVENANNSCISKQHRPILNQLSVNNLLPFLELIVSISPTISHHILLYSIQELSLVFKVNFGPVTSNRYQMVWLLVHKQAYATSFHCRYSVGTRHPHT